MTVKRGFLSFKSWLDSRFVFFKGASALQKLDQLNPQSGQPKLTTPSGDQYIKLSSQWDREETPSQMELSKKRSQRRSSCLHLCGEWSTPQPNTPQRSTYRPKKTTTQLPEPQSFLKTKDQKPQQHWTLMGSLEDWESILGHHKKLFVTLSDHAGITSGFTQTCSPESLLAQVHAVKFPINFGRVTLDWLNLFTLGCSRKLSEYNEI